MRPSKRIEHVSIYYFANKMAEIRQRMAAGKNVINLGIGSPDIAPPNSIIKVLQDSASEDGASKYQSYNGLPELRQAFAKWYKEVYGVVLDSDKELLPLMGSKEAIMYIHLAFCNNGDGVLVPNPGYPSYAASARLLGLNVNYYNLQEKDNCLPDIAALEKMDLSNCKVMWINYPNMPTGAKITGADFKKLIRFAKKHGILLVNDNPYSLILNKNPLSIHSFSDDYEDVLELNSLSKSHSMAGWRVGLVSGSKENIKHIFKVKSNFDSGMYKPIQLAAIQALTLGKEWFEELNNEYRERAAIVYEILDVLNCTYKKENTGMFVWAKVNSIHLTGEKLSDYLLYKHDVFAAPGSVFGTNGENYIRFSLCVDQKQLKAALIRIKSKKS